MSFTKRQFLAGSAAFTGSMAYWSISAVGAKPAPITAAHSVNTTIYAAHMVAQAKDARLTNQVQHRYAPEL